MKKMPLLFLIFFMFTCKNNNSLKKELDNRKDEVVFSLDCSDFKNRPVICIEDSGMNFYFMVDTGNTISRFNENGCKKYKYNLKNGQNYNLTLFIEDKRYLPDEKKHILSMPIEKNDVFSEKQIDGVLGIDFLTQYDNVVFDYREKKIKFNQSPINDYPIEMYKNSTNVYYIYYLLDGIKDFGLLDTGCDSFIVREDYKTDYVDISEMDLKKKVEKSVCIKTKKNAITFNRIKIGKATYNDIIGYFTMDKRVKIREYEAKFHKFRSVLGYPFFKNHVIQLDFKNNLFYID